MAGVNDRALLSVGPWPLGIANAVPEDRLPRDENGVARALREADNVDLDASGTPRRRRGAAMFHQGALCHSLWADPNCPFGLFVDNGELHSLDLAGDAEPLGFAVGPSPLSYALIGERVYFSNRAVSGMIDAALQVRAWACEQPAGQPGVAAVPGYGLPAGQYQVAVTFVDALGRESGTTRAVALELPADHGIALTEIPQPQSAAAVLVYVTDSNDQVLRLHSTLAPGTTTLTISAAATGRVLSTQFLVPMPAGQAVRLFNGRQVVADGRYLRWSPPMRYGLTDPAQHVIPFNARIDLIEPAGGGGQSTGLYVAAGSRTYWLAGADPAAWEPRIRRSSGAVPGSACRAPGPALGFEDAEDVAVWLGRDGQFCVAGHGGAIQTPLQGRAAVDDAERAALLFRADDGIQQVVGALQGSRPQGLQVRDRAIAHVIYEDPTP